MTIFWILAAGLAGLALLFVLAPLLTRRDPEGGVDQDQLNLEIFRSQIAELDADLAAGKLYKDQHVAARRDLERELLVDVNGEGRSAEAATARGGPWTALVLALAVPVSAVMLYLTIGNSTIIPRLEALASGQPAALPAGHPAAGDQAPSVEVLVQRLAEKMEEQPDNLDGWMMLGRTYLAMGLAEQAAAALERAYRLSPGDPDVTVSYAQAVAAGQDGDLNGRPAELIRTALDKNPNHIAGRWLEGLMAYQNERYAEAAARWEAMIALLDDPQGEDASELRQAIAEARARAAGEAPSEPAPPVQAEQQADAPPAAAAQPAETPGAAEAASAASVIVQISLAEPLWTQASDNDTVFIYARASAGPPMPLAAKRVRVAELPVTVTLDDSMAMMPAMRLSAFPEVVIGARVSKSGQATPQSGDLEGEIGPIASAGQADPVTVVIDRVRP